MQQRAHNIETAGATSVGADTMDTRKMDTRKIDVARVCDIRLGRGNSRVDVEIASFLLENNIHHSINPHLVASLEQLAFMVAMDPDQVYVPCSDELFFECMRTHAGARLLAEYARAWHLNMQLLDSVPLSPEIRQTLRGFCRTRLRRTLAFHDVLPQRLVKRLTSAVLTATSPLEDPWTARKARSTACQEAFLQREEIRILLDALPAGMGQGTNPAAFPLSIQALQQQLACTGFARRACLAALAEDGQSNPGHKVPRQRKGDADAAWQPPSPDWLKTAFAGAEAAMAAIWDKVPALADRHSTILLLCDASGGAVQDLALANFLIERGHRVVYAVKEEFYFRAPTLEDVHDDPTLQRLLARGHICDNARIAKKELLRLLREWRLLVISDGTRERLNLLRCSVTFARAWKEADLVLAKGWRLKDVLLGTSHEFTRDVVCWTMEEGRFEVAYKPHAARAHKIMATDIARFAADIIAGMRQAHAQGRPVLFFSCVIGSIPGQTKTAIRLACAIVDDLQKRLPNAHIINPAAHFVEGMDGDDLMYMWEQVQRSGLIDIWHFETADDIERGFALLGEPMPREWMGKDATYSTGCTQEMRIALEVQRENPEMQIRGPDPDTFFRRGDYGVGKYFDASLVRR